MHPLLLARQSLYVDDIGPLRLAYDYVELCSTSSPEDLRQVLPVEELQAASHRFKIEPIDRSPRYASKLKMTGTGNGNPFGLLYAFEDCLGDYAITKVEIAADVLTTSQFEAEVLQGRLLDRMGKRRHHRGYLWVEYKDRNPPRGRGLFRAPTVYFEDATSTIRLKIYVRQDKLLGGGFGNPLLRLEWTLKDLAIKRHLGGNKLERLWNADLRSFVQKNLQLEEVDCVALGPLLCRSVNGRPMPKRRAPAETTEKNPLLASFTDPKYIARRAAHQFLRYRAYQVLDAEEWACGDDLCPKCELMFHICLRCPAQIRGMVREMRGQTRAVRITDYKIDACFKRQEVRVVL
jgi:hypothetical protein